MRRKGTLKKRNEVAGVTYIQSQLSAEEAEALKKLSADMGMSQAKATRQIVLDAIKSYNKEPQIWVERRITLEEQNFLKRVLRLIRSKDAKIVHYIKNTVDTLERLCNLLGISE